MSAFCYQARGDLNAHEWPCATKQIIIIIARLSSLCIIIIITIIILIIMTINMIIMSAMFMQALGYLIVHVHHHAERVQT
jgi:hypothetical protein